MAVSVGQSLIKDQAFGSAKYEFTDTVVVVGAGIPQIIPDGVSNISITLIVGAGSGTIEYTNSSRADVVAGSATWEPSAIGVVAVQTTTSLQPVTAVRAVLSAPGSVTMEMVTA